MTRAIARSLVAGAVLCAAAAPVFAQTAPVRVLEVPYVPQSEELCGGAAAAMVMRYWGATGVFAESFADLVDREAGGIRSGDLVRSLEARGWRTATLAGDLSLLVSTIEARRPPIVLLEDRPGRFHYVVVAGVAGERIVLHDPARAPLRVIDRDAFVRAWRGSGFWMLVVMPGASQPEHAGASLEEDAAETPSTANLQCAAMVDESVRLALGGAVADAEALLRLAADRCPGDEAPWRELAGIHALRKDWSRAAADARRALARNAADEHAARILATSLYLEGDDLGALAAWNLVGEPKIDLVEIRGLRRTRFAVAADKLGLTPRTGLTPQALTRAARRLNELPSAFGSRVSYTPRDDGNADVVAAIVERPLVPSSPFAMAAEGAGGLANREWRVNVASPTGGGELWHAAWRWWDRRPRIEFGVDAPSPFGGTWGIEVSDERETYGRPAAEFELRRRRAALHMSDWATHALRWDARVALERWPTGIASSFAAGVRQHLSDDRLELQARAGAWTGHVKTWTAAGSIDWRSDRSNEGTVWLARGSLDAVGEGAPLMLLPGAGTGHGRFSLLRAHPLLDDGVLRNGVFGRTLAAANGEWRRWSDPIFRVVRFAPAIFVDAARAFDAPDFADSRTHVDVGAGIRLAFPGTGTLRIDLARGLRDASTAVSVAFSR